MSGFLPDKYERPNQGGFYMKFEQGSNRFRALSSAVTGWEKWSDDKKVTRYKMDEDHPEKARHFWAFAVWNYKEERVQILILTQSSIMKAIEGFIADEDYGTPSKYDIQVTKTGQSIDTEYTVLPKPLKPVSAEIKAEFEKYDLNLQALFEAGDTFPLVEKKKSEDLGKNDESIEPSDLPF